jgi:Icc-related predicted phosphoesterase
MKLLLTSDLHRDGTKLLGLLEEAPAHDALLVAGDHLDIFSDTGFTEQKSGALLWREAVRRAGKPFAWCSGNHDFFRGDATPMKGASPLWMRETEGDETCITDGETRVLKTAAGTLAVTTVPWPVTGDMILLDGYRASYLDFVKGLLHAGKKLQAEGLPWIILNHEPPAQTPLATGYVAAEADFARRLLESAQPDFSLHGHIHQAPTAEGGCWVWQLGETICFNAGQSAPGEPGHMILLEIQGPRRWQATWRGDRRTLRAESK